jgi:hypothetical protein
MASEGEGPYAMLEDGTAKDPVAFRAALRADPVKMKALEEDPELGKVILGDDIRAFQELIKSVYEVRASQVALKAIGTLAALSIHGDVRRKYTAIDVNKLGFGTGR